MKQFRIIRNGVAITKWHDCEMSTISQRKKMEKMLNSYSKNWYLEYREVEEC